MNSPFGGSHPVRGSRSASARKSPIRSSSALSTRTTATRPLCRPPPAAGYGGPLPDAYGGTMLTTDRLVLRQWVDDDLDAWAALNADPEVREFFPAVLTRE